MEPIYHFVGIKGSGMSALASIIHDMGGVVQGSDTTNYLFTQKGLNERRIKLYPFNEATLTPQHTVIIGNAFKEHEEVLKARQKGITCIPYHTFLGDFLTNFTSIAVSGTHGKTTTTGLLSTVLKEKEKTAYLIGDGTGVGSPESEYFVFEACEYQRHFLSYRPSYTIITNIEHDHPDYFKDIEDVLDAFQTFANQTKEYVIACGDDLNVKKLTNLTHLMTYGIQPSNDVFATNIEKSENGTSFDVIIKNKFFHRFHTPFFGEHMILNALATITIGYLEWMTPESIEKGLQSFKGVQRRFSETHHHDQIMIDDYAHHPTEIKATLQAVQQKYPTKPLVAIFQPHTFTRTKAFSKEFIEALELADEVYLTDIFGSAREQVETFDLQTLIGQSHKIKYLSFESLETLKQHRNSVLVFMGAGDIQKYQEAYQQLSC